MDLSIHKDIVIEDDSFEVHEEDIWDFIEYISFGCVRTVPTGLTKTIRYQLSSMHAIEGCMEIIFALNLDTVAEESLKTLSFCPTGMANHLCHLTSLKELLKQILIG